MIAKEVERPCNLKKKKSSCRARRYTKELLKYEGEYVLILSKDICNEILTEDDIPQEWNSAYMCCIYIYIYVCLCVCVCVYIYVKINKKFCKSYRGIGIIKLTGRLCSEVEKDKTENRRRRRKRRRWRRRKRRRRRKWRRRRR